MLGQHAYVLFVLWWRAADPTPCQDIWPHFENRAVLGIEPRTSRTRSENHATRPNSQLICNRLSRIQDVTVSNVEAGLLAKVTSAKGVSLAHQIQASALLTRRASLPHQSQRVSFARTLHTRAQVTTETASITTLCPSGLRGWTQVPLARAAWVQIPQVSSILLAARAPDGSKVKMCARDMPTSGCWPPVIAP